MTFEKITRFFEKLTQKLFSKNVFYINGPDNLPPPLSKEEEEKAFLLLENNDPKAKNLLIEHNLRLVVYIAKKFENALFFK